MSKQTTDTSSNSEASVDRQTIDVAHLAGLARLSMTREAKTLAAKDLEAIMSMIDAMQAVDTTNIEPLSHPLDATVRLRADEVTESPNAEHFQRNAPATADQYYLVPRVVE
jgi:aspartyl-tRNA(Asn)/glutamyl-tRNA(Gln) amidotransferase subunit C